jgi:hypothetical protein
MISFAYMPANFRKDFKFNAHWLAEHDKPKSNCDHSSLEDERHAFDTESSGSKTD